MFRCNQADSSKRSPSKVKVNLKNPFPRLSSRQNVPTDPSESMGSLLVSVEKESVDSKPGSLPDHKIVKQSALPCLNRVPQSKFSQAIRQSLIHIPPVETHVEVETSVESTEIRQRPRLKSEVAGQTYKSTSLFHMFAQRQKEMKAASFQQTVSRLKASSTIKWQDSPNDDCQLQVGLKIGQGAFASVFEGFDTLLKIQVAIKVIEKAKVMGNPRQMQLVEQEARLLAGLPHHPNVCQFYRLAEDSKKICFVMEYCGSKTLNTWVIDSDLLPEDRVKSVFRGLVEGVVFLHNHKVYHRDIKCTNVLVTTGNIAKIIDFGLSTSSDELNTEATGTPFNFAPEQVRREAYSPSKVDTWCLGLILYALLYKKPLVNRSPL